MVAALARFTQRRSQPRQFSLAASLDGRISRRDTSQQRSFSPRPPASHPPAPPQPTSDALRSVHATSCSRRSPLFGCHNTTAGQRSDVRSLDLLLGTGGGEEKGRRGGGESQGPARSVFQNVQGGTFTQFFSGRGVSPCLSSTFQPPGEDEMSLLAVLHT